MKLRHPLWIALAALFAAWVVRLWTATLRRRIHWYDHRRHPTDPRKEAFIYVFWHEALLLPTLFPGRISVLISQHADGELIARAIQHLGFRVVRGSTTRGGTRALVEMIDRGKQDWHLAITPDGPRGPRRQLQAGVVFLASLTGLPVVPLGIACQSAWRAKSWDRMMLPRPWSSAFGVVGETIRVPGGLDRKEIERHRLRIEEALLRATHAAEDWAQHGRRPKRIVERTEPVDAARAA